MLHVVISDGITIATQPTSTSRGPDGVQAWWSGRGGAPRTESSMRWVAICMCTVVFDDFDGDDDDNLHVMRAATMDARDGCTPAQC
jgi:hypothetical protein